MKNYKHNLRLLHFRKFIRCPLSILAIVVLINFETYAQNASSFEAGNKTVNITDFDKEVRTMINGAGIPGISIAIINNNQIVYSNNYGVKQLDNQAPVDENTVFEAASLTKIFLVYVAHKLVDQGKLKLDKPLHEYMPYPDLAHDERYKKITPRMVLSHSSGIENWRWYNNRDTLEITSTPGERFVYSGEGFHYLSAVIEKILDKPYEQFVQEMILEPFELQNTYLKYDTTKGVPSNYATGHTFFTEEVEKWKNTNTVPASGNHLTAKDFGELIVQTFNKENLSDSRISDIVASNVKMAPQSPDLLYMGAGYMVNYSETDTTVSFAGSNEGYKAWVSYSVSQHDGLVFLTNSDIGVSALKRLNELTVNLSIDPLLKLLQFPQYPSSLFTLLNAFNDDGSDEMFVKISELHNINPANVEFSTLDMLSSIIFKTDGASAKRLMQENVKLHPENPTGYYNLGQINMAMNNYELAYNNFKKCKELKADFSDLDDNLELCLKKMAN